MAPPPFGAAPFGAAPFGAAHLAPLHLAPLGTFPRYETRTNQGPTVPALAWKAFDFNDGTLLDDDYIAFTITPDSGMSLDYESLSFIHRFGGNNGSDVVVFSSQDGFTAGSEIETVQLRVRNEPTSFTVDLSALEPTGNPVEFRLYFNTNATFDVDTFIDEITLSASSQSVVSDDVDGNRIKDAWEVTHFGEAGLIDGSGDADGDGVLDFFEYLYGSGPNDATEKGFALFAQTGGVVAPTSGITFNWSVESGFSLGVDYELRISTDLSQWDTIPAEHYTVESIPDGSRTDVQLELTHDYGENVFLRLVKP